MAGPIYAARVIKFVGCSGTNLVRGPKQLDIDMFWMIPLVIPIGVLLGLKYKVSSVITSSIVIVALMSALAIRGGWSPSAAGLATIASVISLQLAYLLGLLISAKGPSGQRQKKKTPTD